ncbi:MAG: V-type ATP synthase subunit K [Acetivibrionales bacterium]|jgi:V/A-type H+-transporting ATPase subunit K|nr:V-type ATP synthase subunit K [Clostridiaceae bacterium]
MPDLKFVDLFLNPKVYAILGAVISFLVAALGSSKACGISGQAAAGVITEEPSRFSATMILQALPATQSIYGFVIAFMIIGKISGVNTLENGLSLFATGLPVGIVGYISAIWQGKVATAGIHLVAKRPEALGNAIIYALMVEMFAILSLVVSILMLGQI